MRRSAYHADKYAFYSNYKRPRHKQEFWWAASFAVQQPPRLIFGVERRGHGIRPIAVVGLCAALVRAIRPQLAEMMGASSSKSFCRGRGGSPVKRSARERL